MERRIRPALFKPVLLVGAAGALAVVTALLLLVVTSSNALRLVEPVHLHLKHMASLQEVSRAAHELLARQLGQEAPPAEADVERVREKLARLIAEERHLSVETPARINRARDALAAFVKDPPAALLASLIEIKAAIHLESTAQAALVERMHDYALSEYRLAAVTLVALPLLAALAFLLLRGRVLDSMERISAMLELLSRHDFTPVVIDKDTGDLRPVFEAYNHLVTRLTAAETENAARRDSLERQVRAATTALLRQGRALAEADRLAAVGEASARIAHELRNPLAGIELALSNLRAESGASSDLHSRLGPMIAELQRMSRLLTGLLEQGALTVEAATDIPLGRMVEETAELVRYQARDDIAIVSEISDKVICLLPADTLRQVIFNLILNSTQAIGARAGRIDIRAAATRDVVTLTFEDDGPGFPADLLASGPRMFDSRRKEGTGLGLATVRRLVDRMGGRIAFANRGQGGALVDVELPCRKRND